MASFPGIYHGMLLGENRQELVGYLLHGFRSEVGLLMASRVIDTGISAIRKMPCWRTVTALVNSLSTFTESTYDSWVPGRECSFGNAQIYEETVRNAYQAKIKKITGQSRVSLIEMSRDFDGPKSEAYSSLERPVTRPLSRIKCRRQDLPECNKSYRDSHLVLEQCAMTRRFPSEHSLYTHSHQLKS